MFSENEILFLVELDQLIGVDIYQKMKMVGFFHDDY